MTHPRNPETTQHRVLAKIAEHETPQGTRIECQTTIDGDTSGISARLSREFGQNVVAGPSTWIFKGPGHEAAASFVVRICGLARQTQPDMFEGYGAVPLPGNTGKEPMVGVVIASAGTYDPAEVAATAQALAIETNRLLEDGQSAIRLPLTD